MGMDYCPEMVSRVHGAERRLLRADHDSSGSRSREIGARRRGGVPAASGTTGAPRRELCAIHALLTAHSGWRSAARCRSARLHPSAGNGRRYPYRICDDGWGLCGARMDGGAVAQSTDCVLCADSIVIVRHGRDTVCRMRRRLPRAGDLRSLLFRRAIPIRRFRSTGRLLL